MKKLVDILWASQHKEAVVADCVRLIETHVASRSGLKGMALKTGLTMLKRTKPGILERATRVLLPEFIDALEPLHQEFRATHGRDFGVFLQINAHRASKALLAVADRRVRESDSQTVQSTYARMRGGAEAEVLAAMPALVRLFGSRRE
jgi:hypothetical protein